MMPSPVNLSTVPPHRSTTVAAPRTRAFIISRNRSAPTAAATSIECTTSANSTVTCLYSAAAAEVLMDEPHSSQNFAVARNLALHDGHATVDVVTSAPPIQVAPPQSLRIGGLPEGSADIDALLASRLLRREGRFLCRT